MVSLMIVGGWLVGSFLMAKLLNRGCGRVTRIVLSGRVTSFTRSALGLGRTYRVACK